MANCRYVCGYQPGLHLKMQAKQAPFFYIVAAQNLAVKIVNVVKQESAAQACANVKVDASVMMIFRT